MTHIIKILELGFFCFLIALLLLLASKKKILVEIFKKCGSEGPLVIIICYIFMVLNNIQMLSYA